MVRGSEVENILHNNEIVGDGFGSGSEGRSSKSVSDVNAGSGGSCEGAREAKVSESSDMKPVDSSRVSSWATVLSPAQVVSPPAYVVWSSSGSKVSSKEMSRGWLVALAGTDLEVDAVGLRERTRHVGSCEFEARDGPDRAGLEGSVMEEVRGAPKRKVLLGGIEWVRVRVWGV